MKLYKNISEENKIIMNFMEDSYYCTKDYSSSWDLLMSVIKKIKDLNNTNFQFSYVFQYSVDSAAWSIVGMFYRSYVSNDLHNTWLENNFYAVVEFIKYYNTFVIKKENGKKSISEKSEHVK